MTIVVNTSTVVFWIITLAVQRSYCAVTPLVLSTNEPEKNGQLSIVTTSNDTKVDWILNGALPILTSCIFSILDCTVPSSGNMVFAANATSTSLTITSLSYNANNGLYTAESDTGASASIQITVSSPVTSVSWLSPPASTCPGTIVSVTLTAAIPCVYPINKIIVVFQIFEQNAPFANISVIPENDGSIGCASHEVNLKATATFDSKNYANKQIQVSASVAHSLLKSKPAVNSNLTDTICFEGLPTTVSTTATSLNSTTIETPPPPVSTTSTSLNSTTTETPPPPGRNNKYIAIISGSIGGGVVVLIIITICCVKHRKKLVQM